MCAFELLATVAGSLLLENETSEDNCVAVQNTVKNEETLVKSVPFSEDIPHQGSSSPCGNVQCGINAVITNPNHLLVGDKVENEVQGLSNLDGSDSQGVNGDVKPDVVVSIGSNSSSHVRACGNNGPGDSQDDINLYSRDDDENFSGCIRPRMSRSVPRIGDRRVRKILASRHWKGGSRNNAGKLLS